VATAAVTVVAAVPADLDRVLALLVAAALPTAGVAEHFGRFLVARADGDVAGCVGLELYGTSGLLRSLAVSPSHRGRGLGRDLAGRALADAQRCGVGHLFLLTETAADFFTRLGFRRVTRAEAEKFVGESVELRSACPHACACMRLDF
jgi:amino-acid N-acetyltransferase